MLTKTIWFPIVATTAFAALFAACGGSSATASAASSCAKLCDCSGCSAGGQTDCEASFDATKNLAEDKGCNATFEAYATCMDDKIQCVAGVPEAIGCDPAAEALTTCIGAPIDLPGPSACDAYAKAAGVCCAKIDDPAARDLCHKNVETVVNAANDDACQAGLDAAKAVC
jgi:hypothetical protein